MIAVHVFLRCRPDAREGFVAALAALQRSTLANDDGCLHYRFYSDLADPDRFVCVEEWTDMDALRRHLEADHHRAGSEALDAGRAEPARIRVFAAEPIEL